MDRKTRIDVSHKLDEIRKILTAEVEFYHKRSRRDFTTKDYAEQTAIELVIDNIGVIKDTLNTSA